MKILRTISYQFKKDKIQRIIYGLALILWVWVWIDDIELYYSDSSLGIKYYWIMNIPTLILLGQMFFNLRVLWWGIVGIIIVSTICIVWNILFLRILLDYHRDYVSGTIWDIKEVMTLTMIFLILFLVNWVVWKIRPEKNKNHFAKKQT